MEVDEELAEQNKERSMKAIFGEFQGGRVGIGLLVFRVVVGLAFVLHGIGKIQHPFDWMGPGMPPVLQGLAALAEFGGGLALIFGLLTPLAAFGIACTMAVAILTAHKGDPFVAKGKSFELAGVYLSLMVMLISTGPGRYSLDAALFGRRRR